MLDEERGLSTITKELDTDALLTRMDELVKQFGDNQKIIDELVYKGEIIADAKRDLPVTYFYTFLEKVRVSERMAMALIEISCNPDVFNKNLLLTASTSTLKTFGKLPIEAKEKLLVDSVEVARKVGNHITIINTTIDRISAAEILRTVKLKDGKFIGMNSVNEQKKLIKEAEEKENTNKDKDPEDTEGVKFYCKHCDGVNIIGTTLLKKLINQNLKVR